MAIIQPLAPEDLGLTSDPHEFENAAADFAGQLDDQGTQTDSLLVAFESDPVTPAFIRMDSEFTRLSGVLANESGNPADAEIGNIAGKIPGVDKLVGAAGSQIPTATGIPVTITPPKLPPIKEQPVEPGSKGSGGSIFPPPSGRPGGKVTARPPQATIINLTTPGDLDFKPGDKYKVYVKSKNPRALITVQGTRNGVAFTTLNVGQTDDNGELVIQGVYKESDAGHWVEHWYADTVLLPGNTDFRVE